MTICKFASIALGSLALAACSSGDGAEGELAGTRDAIVRPTQTGGRNEVVMVYALVANGATRTCSGSYFAPRVVLTAAHCLQNAREVFVYYGDTYAQHASQLQPRPDGSHAVPPPSPTAVWSKADSFEQHPQWDPTLIHPDMGVIYLDRKLPFDPLPLARFRLDSSWNNRQVTISGWGANVATSPTTGAGGQVQRTGRTRILGAPTLADYHADDPNPGMLNATVRNNVIKLDGRAPNSNGCFGDSGGPIIVNQYGQDYIAGVDYFGGLYCEDYGLHVRIDPFLPFLDQAYKKGGQETLIPSLECIAPRTGGYTAYLGYENKNGVSITVPYGSKNQLALDTTSARPALFLPGKRDFAFGVDFGTNQTLSYTLQPDNSPRTTLTVNKNSPVCGAARIECINTCQNTLRSGCEVTPTFSDCMGFCASFGELAQATGCEPAYSAFNQCVATTAPGPESWFCGDGYPYEAIDCQDELNELFTCAGF